MLQLKASLLLLIISTESLLARSSNSCNGYMNLSQETTGHLGFSPGRGGPRRPSSGLMNCTRTLEIPAGRTVLLKLDWLERGSSVSLTCGGDREERTLAVGDTAALCGCDGNIATLTWTGVGHSSDAFQIFYYVQYRESSSTETYPVPGSHPDAATPNPAAPTAAEEGPLSESSPDPSGNSTRNPGLTQPAAPPPSTSANTDREASSFPGEGSNNGPDTSGPPRRADIPGRLDFFSTQRSTSARSEMYTSQNAEFQTVSAPSETAGSGRTYASTEPCSSSQTLGYEEKERLVMSSIGPPLEISSTSLPQKASEAADERHSDSTENWEISRTDIANSLKTQNTKQTEDASMQRDYLRTTNSLLELAEHLSTIPSTEMPSATTKSGATHTNTHLSTLSAQSGSARDSALATSVPFDLSDNSKEPTQETISTESIPRRQSSSLGTSSPSLVPNTDTAPPYVTERDTFRTSTSLNLPSPDSTLREDGKEEARTSPRSSTDLLTTSSFISGRTTSNELPSLPTQPVSNPSSGESYTMHSNGRSAESLSTTSENTISPQEKFEIKTMSSEMLPKTVPSRLTTPSGRSVTASTLLQVSRIPHRAQTSKYRSLPTPTVTGQKGAATVTASHRVTSRTSETVNRVTASTQPYLSAVPFESSTVGRKPEYYIVPDVPVMIKEESFELLLQITVEESTSAWTEGAEEEDAALWLEPYLQKAPGFKGLLGVWTSGHAVQSLVQFHTRGALQWLPRTGASSLLERTGLKQAVREGRRIRASTVTNVTLGGVQEACGWLLQCPSGFSCAFDSRTSNYSCTSVCHSDYCLHGGLCTHHPAQAPLCRCVAGQDFWFMGQRCEVRMTRARLVLSCVGVLLLVLGVVGVLACMAVRRYRALLIQAKVDQTRSSYRRFNHFDELSGRFWLRSWAGSADSVDNPVFSRSDEILQLRALERPCCYHDDSLSLPSTCPSPGTRIRTIYPHSSQYAWRGSELSVGDGVLDSGKASDLSVCSWPREPIQWSPFPLLQQLALQRPPAVRVTRTRSYCDGMELVDINKSWTA